MPPCQEFISTFQALKRPTVFAGSPTKETASPTRSPIKSPRKGQRSKARDVISLPKPYNTLKSDQIKRWNKEMLDGKVVGADNEAELELFKSICFTNALVLKINQLAKQVGAVVGCVVSYFSTSLFAGLDGQEDPLFICNADCKVQNSPS